MAKKKYAPKWKERDYTPYFLTDEPRHTAREIRAEYTRLRDIAMKRAKRFEEIGLEAQADYLRETFPKLAQLPEIQAKARELKKKYPRTKIPEVTDLLARGKKLLDEAQGSLQLTKKIQSLIFNETGEFVKLSKALEFDNFMKSWRLSAFSKTMVPSEEAVEIFWDSDYKEIGGSFSEFYILFNSIGG